MFFGGNLWYYLGDILKNFMAGYDWISFQLTYFSIWEILLGKVSSFNEPAAVVWEALEGHNLTQALQLLHSPGQRKSYTFIRLSPPGHCTVHCVEQSTGWKIRLRAPLVGIKDERPAREALSPLLIDRAHFTSSIQRASLLLTTDTLYHSHVPNLLLIVKSQCVKKGENLYFFFAISKELISLYAYSNLLKMSPNQQYLGS